MLDARRLEEAETLDEATLLARTGIYRRTLTRWRQQGLVLPAEPRHGRGPGLGTTPLRYLTSEVAKIHRLKQLRREFKKVSEWRWRLWLESYSVRIGPDLVNALSRFQILASRIKTLHDIETRISACLPNSADLPRGNPSRAIFDGLARREQRSLVTMVFCILLGVRLPLFDERNPPPFKVFKRVFGLPEDWEMPPGLFDIFPHMHRQILNALLGATPHELESAKAPCGLLSWLLDEPEVTISGAAAAGNGDPRTWRTVKLISSMWRSPALRAAIVGLAILGMRRFQSELLEQCTAALAAFASELGMLQPKPARSTAAESLT
jgi:hypothetical protein